MLSLLVALSAFSADPDIVPPYEEMLPDTPTSFSTAKRRMYDKVYMDHAVTFYCGCAYSDKTPDLGSCGMEGLNLGIRAGRTEVEHVVPASSFGKTRPCWAVGGRNECLKTDPIFRAFHNDLHLLAPAVGDVNAARSDFSMGIIEGDETKFGACDFEVDTEDDKVEPPLNVRGNIARIYFYVEFTYGLTLSEGQRRLLRAWHLSDPVDEWEVERDKRIEELQGNSNPFVR